MIDQVRPGSAAAPAPSSSPAPPPPPPAPPARLQPAAARPATPAPTPASHGFVHSLWSGVKAGDVRAVASTLRTGIGEATAAGRQGITDATYWSAGKVGQAADFARSRLTGHDPVSAAARGLVTQAEQSTRFQIGVVGGVAREATGLVGGIGQLAVTAGEIQASPEAARDYGRAIVGTVAHAGAATGHYVHSVVNDPGRLAGDAKAAWAGASHWVGGQVDRYKQAIAQGRGAETAGLDTGTVVSYLIPVGEGARAAGFAGHAAEALTEGTGRVLAEGATRDGLQTAARAGARLRPAVETVTPLRPAVTPELTHASALRADAVYGRGAAPAGDRLLSFESGTAAERADAAAELLHLTGLRPAQLTGARGAFKAEVFVSGSREAPTAVHIAFRGTRVSSLRDWTSNLGQGLGANVPHYRQALEIGKAVARFSDPALEVTFSGHSLGGGLAAHAAHAAGRQAVTFNAAGLHAATRLRGAAAAAMNGVAAGVAENRFVPGEILTTLQQLPLVPKAFGTSEALQLVAPAGKAIARPLTPGQFVDRHMMDWVLAGTGRMAGR